MTDQLDVNLHWVEKKIEEWFLINEQISFEFLISSQEKLFYVRQSVKKMNLLSKVFFSSVVE